jgi:hypothetical protein
MLQLGTTGNEKMDSILTVAMVILLREARYVGYMYLCYGFLCIHSCIQHSSYDITSI